MQLDYAKRHLTHTITSLRRLAMLTAAVDDLEQVSTGFSMHQSVLGLWGHCTILQLQYCTVPVSAYTRACSLPVPRDHSSWAATWGL